MIYTDPFGGSTIQPAQVGYSAIALAASITLAWPQDSFSSTQPVFSRLTDVTPSAGGFSVTLPDARRVSNGYDAFFSNRGAFTFTVNNAAGTPIATVTAGEVRYIYLVDNATEAGSWRSFGMGSLASPGDAASLVGRGLAADGAQLRVSSQTATFASNYTVVAADLGKTYVWTGGAGTLTLPAVAVVQIGSTFFFNVANQGTGALTIAASGGELVDGASSIVLQPSESAILHAGPAAWYTVGRGRNTQFNYTLLSKSITGGTVTLTPSEASNVVQVYTGVLVSACNVVLPSVVQVYFVSNQTTGAFTTTFKTSGVGTTVTVPQGQNAVLLCDGLNIVNSSTTASGLSSLQLAVGAVGSPSLSFVGDPTTGMYQIASGNVTFTITGVQTVNFSNAGITIPIAGGNLNFTSTGATPGQINYYGSGFLELVTRTAAAGVKLYVANGALSTTWSAAGNVLLAAPGAGVALTVTGIVGGASHVAAFGGATGNQIVGVSSTSVSSVAAAFRAANATRAWQFGVSPGLGTDAWTLFDETRNAVVISANATGNVVVSAPSSGNALKATGVVGARAALLDTSVSTTPSGLDFQRAGVLGGLIVNAGANADFGAGVVAGDFVYRTESGGHSFLTSGGARMPLRISDAGNVSIAAPAGGNALTIGGVLGIDFSGGNGTRLMVAGGATTGHYYADFQNTSGYLRWGVESSVGGILLAGSSAYSSVICTMTATSLHFGTNGSVRQTISGAGNVTIAAPGAGVALTVSGGGLAVTGASVLTGAVSGVTTLAIGGALTGATTGAFSSTVSMAGLTATTGTFSGALSGVTTLSMGGALTGATTGAFSGAVSTGNLTVTGSTSGTVNVNATGQLYGSALHNNAGAVTGTTNQYVASGTYTPTLTNTANISASTAHVCQWIRVGNVCTVSGRVDVDAAALALTTMGISLPIPSALTLTTQLGGSAVPDGVFGNVRVAGIFGDAINDRATFQLNTDSLANETYFFSFTYLVL